MFTDRAEAKEHFGDYLDDSPLCLIKGQDGGLAARVRELEAEVMDAYKQRNEYENDARLYHELRSEVDRRTNGHGLFMHLDYLEGEKIVLQERIAELEAQRIAAPPEGTLDLAALRTEIGTVLRQVELTTHRADALPPADYRVKPTIADWRERVTWLVNVLKRTSDALETEHLNHLRAAAGVHPPQERT